MHPKKAEGCESWMTDEEKRIMKKQMAAMREQEEAGARLGKPTEIGIADRVLPLIRKTQHSSYDSALGDIVPLCEGIPPFLGNDNREEKGTTINCSVSYNRYYILRFVAKVALKKTSRNVQKSQKTQKKSLKNR